MFKRLFIILFSIVVAIISIHAVELNISCWNIDDETMQDEIEFKEVDSSAGFVSSEQFIRLDFKGYTDAPRWKIEIYTENDEETYKNYRGEEPLYQLGGLMNINKSGWRLPLAWKVFDSTASAITGDPDTPDTDWYWLKDKNDMDIPTTSNNNESWATAHDLGYTLVCQGTPETCELNTREAANSPVYVYLKGEFDNILPGNYRGTIWFDMYPFLGPPVIIHHTPIKEVLGRSNNFVVFANVQNGENLISATLHYKLDSGDWQNTSMVINQTVSSTTVAGTINSSLLKGVNSISYAFVVYDGLSYWWKSIEDPQITQIVDTVTFVDIQEGEVEIEDGNLNDGATKIVIPQGALLEPVDISIELLNTSTLPKEYFGKSKLTGEPVVAFDFRPDGLRFKKPIELTLLYYDLDNDGIVEFPDGTPSGINENELQMCWWDNFEWRMLGGIIDPQMNTVSVRTDHFSIYALFAPGDMTANDYRPSEKIITPATPQDNDFAYFNGLNGQDFKINIYDVQGRKVKTISSPQLPQWDGKDENGNIVESGVYIYQFEANVSGSNKLISGTVVVAK